MPGAVGVRSSDHAETTADQELLSRLQQDGFQGPAWERTAEALVRYGYAAVSKRIRSGQIVADCSRRKLKGVPAGSRLPFESREITDLTELTVAEAICAFREILRQGRWSAEGGASLTTFFLGQCFIRFPDAYRRWLREARPASWTSIHRDDGAMMDVPDPHDDVEETIERLDVVRRLSIENDRTRRVVTRRVEGYSQREIGAELGLSAKAVEALLYRYRRRLGSGGELS